MAAISGTATLDGAAIEGAKIHVINSDSDTHVGTDTTGTDGSYSVTVPDDTAEYAVFAQYEDSTGNQYDTEGRPFITL